MGLGLKIKRNMSIDVYFVEITALILKTLPIRTHFATLKFF